MQGAFRIPPLKLGEAAIKYSRQQGNSIWLHLCLTGSLVLTAALWQISPARAQVFEFPNDPEPMTKASGKIPVKALRSHFYYGNYKKGDLLLQQKASPDSAYIYDVWRAVSLYKHDRLEEAEVIFKRCLPLHDVSNWVKFCAADNYFRLNEPVKAISVFESIPINKYDSKFFATRASCYQMVNQDDAAIADLISASKLEPEHRCLRLACAAQIQNKHGRYKEAVTLLDQAFDGSSPVAADISLRILRGFCLVKLNRSPEAIKDFSAVIAFSKRRDVENNPRVGMALSQAYKARSECYEKAGQKKLAAADKVEYERISKTLCDDLMGK